jgi:hypothetical protein
VLYFKPQSFARGHVFAEPGVPPAFVTFLRNGEVERRHNPSRSHCASL